MFEDALRYPWNGEKNLETLVIGGVLGLLSILLVPVVLVYGYLVRVLRQTMDGETAEPPTFGEWESLLVDGLKALVVTVVYGLIPAAILTVATVAVFVPIVVVSSGAGETATTGALGLGILGALLAILVAAVLALAAVYLIPAAVVAMIRGDGLGAAFSPGTVRTVAFSNDYARAWLVAVAINLLAAFVGGALAVTGVGVVLVPFVNFYGAVAGAYAIGVGVSDLPISVETDRPAGEGTTV